MSHRIEHDTMALEWVVIHFAIPALGALFTLFWTIYVISRLSLAFAVIVACIAPLVFITTHLYQRSLRDSWHSVHDHDSWSFSVLREALGLFRLVKTCGQEAREGRRFVEHLRRAQSARLSAITREGRLTICNGVLITIGTALILWIGICDAAAGNLTAGDLVVVVAYASQFYAPLQSMSRQVACQERALASLERAFEILEQPVAPPESLHPNELCRAAGSITFDRVSFGYHADRMVLHNIDLKIPSGTVVGIVGRTGAGKTTLIGLLLRLYDPSAGRIMLDGIDIRDYRQEDLRKQFAVVTQEPVLFSDTVAGNIAYGQAGTDIEDLIEAAKAAEAHEFITRLPQGYDTKLGERGAMLSGGERQRLSLARAFLNNAPFLILDEPTSALDLRTEESILRGIRKVSRNRTSFIISHRQSILRHCDVLLILEDGKVKPYFGNMTVLAKDLSCFRDQVCDVEFKNSW